MTGPYDDIIRLSRPRSDKRVPMSITDRAAQFSPFAALTGFEGAIQEAGRLTDSKTELDASEQEILDRKQQLLMEAISNQPAISVTYFSADSSKAGGAYLTVSGTLKKIDLIQRVMILTSGEVISLDDIMQIDSPLFDML